MTLYSDRATGETYDNDAMEDVYFRRHRQRAVRADAGPGRTGRYREAAQGWSGRTIGISTVYGPRVSRIHRQPHSS